MHLNKKATFDLFFIYHHVMMTDEIIKSMEAFLTTLNTGVCLIAHLLFVLFAALGTALGALPPGSARHIVHTTPCDHPCV